MRMISAFIVILFRDLCHISFKPTKLANNETNMCKCNTRLCPYMNYIIEIPLLHATQHRSHQGKILIQCQFFEFRVDGKPHNILSNLVMG